MKLKENASALLNISLTDSPYLLNIHKAKGDNTKGLLSHSISLKNCTSSEYQQLLWNVQKSSYQAINSAIRNKLEAMDLDLYAQLQVNTVQMLGSQICVIYLNYIVNLCLFDEARIWY